MNTPAVTIVAACIRAETGVGPSIASGSQVCNPNCADLPIAPINSSIVSTVIASALNHRKVSSVSTYFGANIKISSKTIVSKSK